MRTRCSPSTLVGVMVLVLVCAWCLLLPLDAATRVRSTTAKKTTSATDDKITRSGRSASGTAGKDKRRRVQAKDEESDAKEEEGLFLKETSGQDKFLPDVFRCPECGYEQDEPGVCPDHDQSELIKVLSEGKSPLAPAEVDGNEDILVDIPLTGLVLRNTAADAAAAAAPAANNTAGSAQKNRNR